MSPHPPYCSCAPGPCFPAAEVEAARVRVLKRRIRRRVAAMIAARDPRLALLLNQNGGNCEIQPIR